MGNSLLGRDDYTVALICATPFELAAASELLDEEYEPLPQGSNDDNTYTFGRIGPHHVVLACLPAGRRGIGSVAGVANTMKIVFTSMRFGLLLGIGSGVPTETTDIRLGDVVVSQPHEQFGGVVQYDRGRREAGGKFIRTGMLNSPPRLLLAALQKVKANYSRGISESNEYLEKLCSEQRGFQRPATDTDLLFPAISHHIGGPSCDRCHKEEQICRLPREKEVVVHYGTIASGDLDMQDSETRQSLSQDLGGVLCFETEAAGLMNDFPCLIIRGICDYADSHKNAKWQSYAAASAACYAKDLLNVIPEVEVTSTRTATQNFSSTKGFNPYRISFSMKDIRPVNNFVGRNLEIEKLKRVLLPQPIPCERKICILHGLGGIGKTQLAIAFARKHVDCYSFVAWVDGSTRDSVKRSIAAIAMQLPEGHIPEKFRSFTHDNDSQIDAVVEKVLEWFAIPENRNWLLIFDNIDRDHTLATEDLDAFDVYQYFPQADHGCILITSRLRHVLSQYGIGMELKEVNDDDARVILTTAIGSSFQDTTGIEELLQLLGNLPLALAHAGAYIKESNCSISRYIEEYKERWDDGIDSSDSLEASLLAYPGRSIYNTWRMSYEHVTRIDKAAAQLLLLFSCLDNNEIWLELFLPKDGPYKWMSSPDLPQWFRDGSQNSRRFNKLIRILLGISLIEPKQDPETYSVHPVVHEWAHDMLIGRQKRQFSWLAARIVTGAIPFWDHQERWKIEQRLLPHTKRCFKYILANSGEAIQEETDQQLIAETFHRVGNFYAGWDMIKEASFMLEKAMAVFEKEFGPENALTVHTVHDLGNVHLKGGNFIEAERLFDRALATKERIFGPEHILTLNTANALGCVYLEEGTKEKLVQSTAMFLRVLEAEGNIQGMDNISTQDTLNNLCSIYIHQRRFSEANQICHGVLDWKTKNLGPNHPSTLAALNCVAKLYYEIGKLEEAESFYLRAKVGIEKVYGRSHSKTLQTIFNLANVYSTQGNLIAAEAMSKQALVGYQKLFGPSHILTLQSMDVLSMCYKDQSRLEEAEILCREGVVEAEKSLGADDRTTMHLIEGLGIIYLNRGNLAEAEIIFKKVLAWHEKTENPDHPWTLSTLSFLSKLYKRIGRIAEAYALSQQVLSSPSRRIYCDVCDVRFLAFDIHYHCSTCNDNDFDFCQNCFDNGAHCLEQGHALMKRGVEDGEYIEIPQELPNYIGAKKN